MYPDLFNKLIKNFQKLPGVGQKTATRYAFSMLDFNQTELLEFANQLQTLKSNILSCQTCGFISDDIYCTICKDRERDNQTILVVSHIQDVLAIEKADIYKGTYHILNGNISANKGIMPQDLNIDSLIERVKNTNVKEIILALSHTVDGEITSLYLTKLLKNYHLTISKFAQGLSFGTSLDYTDELTISKAITNRTKVE